MKNLSHTDIRSKLSAKGKLNFTEGFELARACAGMLSQVNNEGIARDLIIRGLEVLDRFPDSIKPVWNDLVGAAGLYPYMASENLSGSEAIRHEYHRSAFLSSYFLHREQQELSAQLLAGKSLILSAPTSFGKSLLIEEVVASGRYKNIVVIQPTLALLDETRKKLSKYDDKYRIIVSTHQTPSDTHNLFLFTAERVVEYDKLPPIEFFVIDEFYKLSLSRDDERAITLNQALYILLKHTECFYLLGPNVKHISDQFVADHGALWRRSDYSTVAVDVEQVYKGKGWKGRDERREKDLFSLLFTLADPTIIYCSSPLKATKLAQGYTEYLENNSTLLHEKKLGKENGEIIEWLEDNIHEQWALSAALKLGIGVHHGSLPRHLGSAIVDAFNDRSIRYLFCTSTLIEGVNTAARNIALFDQKKGLKPIDYFDYKNIVGRSGRMKIHYVGHVFEFHQEPTQAELDVDVPLFSQANAPLELLVQLDGEDVKPDARSRLDDIRQLDPDLQAIIKKNSGISVLGQIAFVKELNAAAANYHLLFNWDGFPKYRQLEAVLDFCWRHLLKENDSKAGVRSHGQLAVMTMQYCHEKSLRYVILKELDNNYWIQKEPDEYLRVQHVVNLVLGVARQWFDFKLPKLLSAASELQAYVFNRHDLKPGNYSYLSALLENSFFKGALSVLLDYDVPSSAIRKLEAVFTGDDDWPAVERKLRSMKLEEYGLLPYEIRKVRAALGLAQERRRLT